MTLLWLRLAVLLYGVAALAVLPAALYNRPRWSQFAVPAAIGAAGLHFVSLAEMLNAAHHRLPVETHEVQSVLALILVLLFLAWWGSAVWRAWRTTEPGPFARAAAIASAAVLVHSLADFPLRTAAIAACFGMCMALLADGRAAPPKEKQALRRKRHVEFK